MIRTTVSLVAFASLLSLSTLVGCGGTQPAPAAPSAPSEAAPAAAPKGAVKEFGEAAVGDLTKCPVSGEEFTVEATSPKAEHNGKTYYFCCGGCKAKFEANPAKFTTKK
jgi:YHS domain-containing protein